MDKVLLIRKSRPVWQAGLLNGIGGKIEPGETPLNAMTREFKEETGLATEDWEWRPFAELRSDDFEVVVYCSFGEDLEQARSLTDEPVSSHTVNLEYLRTKGVANVATLVNAALDMEHPFVSIAYGTLAHVEAERLLKL